MSELTLQEVRIRLSELVEKLSFEVDVDTAELEECNRVIMASGAQMTPAIARELKKNIDEIQFFIDHQRDMLHKLLNGVTTGKKAVQLYRQKGLKSQSRFVYKKA